MTVATDHAKLDSGPQLIARVAGGAISVEGELREANAHEFEKLLQDFATETVSEIRLDLSGLDIDDGVALAAAINALRRVRARSSKLVLAGAPQMLCHNLYRIGLLEGRRAIELIDMRQDEPAGF
jgi:anti-anti-sigma factor